MSDDPKDRSWSGVARAVGIVTIAACCAVVFHTRVYKQFDPVRIRIVETNQISADRSVVLTLPDVASLSGSPTAIILRLRNRSAEARNIGMVVSGAWLGRFVIPPGQTIRIDLSVPAHSSLNTDDRLQLIGDGDDWVLQYLELSNVHGFSYGLFSFVITRDDAVLFDQASGITAFFLFVVWLVLPILMFRLNEGRAIRFVSLISGATVLCFLSVVLILPVVSEYKLMLSVQAFSLCVMTLYGLPAVSWLVRRAARPWVVGMAVVARSVVSALRSVPYRKHLAHLGQLGTGLVLWPLAGIRHLVSRVRRRPTWAVGSIVVSALVLFFSGGRPRIDSSHISGR